MQHASFENGYNNKITVGIWIVMAILFFSIIVSHTLSFGIHLEKHSVLEAIGFLLPSVIYAFIVSGIIGLLWPVGCFRCSTRDKETGKVTVEDAHVMGDILRVFFFLFWTVGIALVSLSYQPSEPYYQNAETFNDNVFIHAGAFFLLHFAGWGFLVAWFHNGLLRTIGLLIVLAWRLAMIGAILGAGIYGFIHADGIIAGLATAVALMLGTTFVVAVINYPAISRAVR